MLIGVLKNLFCDKADLLVEMLNEKYGHKISIDRGFYKDIHGNLYPWYTYPAIEYLSQFNYKDRSIFEWGSGYSSIFWAKRAKIVFSAESDDKWFKKILDIRPYNLNILYKKEGLEYINAISISKNKFDVIIIDGKNRFQCARLAPKFLKKGGFIILDNSDWYPKSSKYLREKGYLEVDFSGIGPINNYTWTTSIYFDRNFRFSTIKKTQPVHSMGAIRQFAKEI